MSLLQETRDDFSREHVVKWESNFPTVEKKQRVLFTTVKEWTNYVVCASREIVYHGAMAEIDRTRQEREKGLRKTSKADRPARPTGKNREADSFYDDDCVHVKDTFGWTVWIISTSRR